MTLAKTASVMLNKLLIKVLLIALLLVFNEFTGNRQSFHSMSTPAANGECRQPERAGWLAKKYQEYRADLQYLHLFVRAYKQLDRKP